MGHQIFVVDLLLHEFSFVGWHWVPGEKTRDVFCQADVDVTFFLKNPLVLGIEFYRNGIIVLVLHELMIRDVMVHGAVSRLRDELVARWIPLLLSAAVHAMLDYCPAEVEVRQFALLDGTSC